MTEAPSFTRNFFHTGMVVARLEEAMEEYSAALQATWRGIRDQQVVIHDEQGVRPVRIRSVHTIEGPPQLELIEHVDGTVWNSRGSGVVHHLGFSTNDVAAAAAHLEASGLRRLVSGRRANEAVDVFVYFGTGSGSIIEMMDESVRAELYADPVPKPWLESTPER